MSLRGSCLGACAAVLALAAPAAADTTLGTVTAPSGSTSVACPAAPPNVLFTDVSTSVPTTPDSRYAVPAGAPQALTKWSINAAGAVPGAQATLVVLRIDFLARTVTPVVTDTEPLTPNPAAGDVDTFTLATPAVVQPGDTIGLYLPGAGVPGISCYWGGSPAGASSTVGGVPPASPPVAGQPLTPGGGGGGISSADSLLNVGATLTNVTADAALTLSAAPANAIVGQPAILTATVTNNGPVSTPITFTDPVPSGLSVQLATADSGTCGTNAAVGIVTCTFPSIPAGHSAKAAIIVTPATAQTYTDSGAVAVTGGAADPNPANDSASTTLAVTAPTNGPTKCVVPKLGRSSVALAKRLLGLLGCKLGKTKKAYSKSVAKGVVISTSPGAGTYPPLKAIVLKVSSGSPPKKHRHTSKTSGR